MVVPNKVSTNPRGAKALRNKFPTSATHIIQEENPVQWPQECETRTFGLYSSPQNIFFSSKVLNYLLINLYLSFN